MTVTKTLSSSQIFLRNDTLVHAREETLVLPMPKFYILVLVLTVILSALSLVYVKDLNRRLFVEYQTIQRNYIQLQANEGKLLVEQNTLAPHTKIQEIAEQHFNMQMPAAKDVVLVKV